MEVTVPKYKHNKGDYILIRDLPEDERGELERWIFGQFQPLLQGKVQDAVFLVDYLRFLDIKQGNRPLTKN